MGTIMNPLRLYCDLWNKTLLFFAVVHIKENELLRNVPYDIVEGRQGSKLILDDFGFLYKKNYDCKNGDSYWTCSKKNTLKCRCCLKVSQGLIQVQKNQHNHQPASL